MTTINPPREARAPPPSHGLFSKSPAKKSDVEFVNHEANPRSSIFKILEDLYSRDTTVCVQLILGYKLTIKSAHTDQENLIYRVIVVFGTTHDFPIARGVILESLVVSSSSVLGPMYSCNIILCGCWKIVEGVFISRSCRTSLHSQSKTVFLSFVTR